MWPAPETDDVDQEIVDALDGEAAAAPEAVGQPAAAPAGSVDDAQLARLVHCVVYQDEAAFAALYRGLAGRVYAQVLRITRDSGGAEEVVEDVFWQVWRQAARFDPARGSVWAWVRRIARSRAIDALRAQGADPLLRSTELDPETQGSAIDADDHDTPADPQCLVERQRERQIENALALLDPLRRQLVSLAFLRGCSQVEIAEQTGLPLGTVKSHIRRALLVMKQAIDDAAAAPDNRRMSEGSP